jgi:hypothetical protein
MHNHGDYYHPVWVGQPIACLTSVIDKVGGKILQVYETLVPRTVLGSHSIEVNAHRAVSALSK